MLGWRSVKKIKPNNFVRLELKTSDGKYHIGYWTGNEFLETEGHKIIKSCISWRYLPKKDYMRFYKAGD